MNPLLPLFFLAPSIPPFNSKPPWNLLFIHTPSEKLFIASRNLSLSPRISAKPRRNSIPSMQMRALRSQDIPLLPLARNHDKTRISIFRVIAPLAFHCNRRFPFNRSPFDNGEIFPRERERERELRNTREEGVGFYRGRRGALLSFTRESSSREGVVKGGG